MLTFSEVTIRVGTKTLLSSVAGAFPSGQVNALYGPNGAGKSTLLHFFQGSIETSNAWSVSGQFSINDTPANNLTLSERAARILCLGAHLNAPFDHTVDEYLEIVSSSLPIRSNTNLEQILSEADLLKARHRSLTSLSSGEIQRLLFVRALYQKADWVIFDETFSQLDPGSLAFAEDVLMQLTHLGVGVLVVTHDVRWVLRSAAKVMVLSEGRIIAEGAPTAVITKELLTKLYPKATTSSLLDLIR
jgi:iron complex transport system ATP-binding protein